MQIDLALFANLAGFQPDGRGGRSSRPIDLAEGSTIANVVTLLGLPGGPRIVLVNGRHADDDQVLTEGDRLAIFPPVAGG